MKDENYGFPNWPSRENVPDEEVAFRVNYDPKHWKYIAVNGHTISRPHFTSDISGLFQYIHTNANRVVTRQEVEDALKFKLKKGMDDVLRDLGFRGALAQAFFDEMTNGSVHFVNPVTWGRLRELKIDFREVYDLIFSPKRKGGLRGQDSPSDLVSSTLD